MAQGPTGPWATAGLQAEVGLGRLHAHWNSLAPTPSFRLGHSHPHTRVFFPIATQFFPIATCFFRLLAAVRLRTAWGANVAQEPTGPSGARASRPKSAWWQRGNGNLKNCACRTPPPPTPPRPRRETT